MFADSLNDQEVVELPKYDEWRLHRADLPQLAAEALGLQAVCPGSLNDL
jgi:hypothetical protein